MKSGDLFFHSLKAISPIDGRHRMMTAPLAEWFSEYALFKYRIHAEVEYLIELSEMKEFDCVRDFSSTEKEFLRNIIKKFSLEDAMVIQDIDRFGHDGKKPINHDMKAAEYFIKNKLKNSTLADVVEMVHFGLTSEDANNIAYNCMIRGCMDFHYIPALVNLLENLAKLAESEKTTPMLSRTHGQPATPTTFGKEMANYLERLRIELITLNKMKLPAKLNGAVGNHNAQHFAAPEVDWILFSKDFITKLGFEPNLLTTQIEPHDGLTRFFSTLISINNILRDLSVDMWLYISQGYLVQKKLGHEVGSSTMPHKINPWRMEVAEGSTVEANAKLSGFIWKLQTSRLQRDLSDHEAQRAIGVGIAHSYLAVLHIAEELDRISIDRNKLKSDLEGQAAILTEAVQTLLRKEGYNNAYEMMKDFARGEHVTISDLYNLINKLDISEATRQKLKSLTPEAYTGLAERLAIMAVQRWNIFRQLYEPPVPKIKRVIFDCDSLSPSMLGELSDLSEMIQERGMKVIGINAPIGLKSLMSGTMQSDELVKDNEALFVGAVGKLFDEASRKIPVCVNLEEISNKKSEYNVSRLYEVINLIDSLDRM